jgi:hypothetical protein
LGLTKRPLLGIFYFDERVRFRAVFGDGGGLTGLGEWTEQRQGQEERGEARAGARTEAKARARGKATARARTEAKAREERNGREGCAKDAEGSVRSVAILGVMARG